MISACQHRFVPALVTAALLSSGCAVGQLQTARTVPAGEVRTTLGVGLVDNELEEQRGGFAFTQITPHISLRVGLDERVDIGARVILGGGGTLDAKVNLAPLDAPYALSVSAGVGAGGFITGGGAWSLTVPVVALASYDIDEVITPYIGVGYAFWWHYGYDEGLLDISSDPLPRAPPAPTYAERAGYGDGVLMLTLGVEVPIVWRLRVLVEYDYWTQIVDDEGDFYEFVDTHLFQVGASF